MSPVRKLVADLIHKKPLGAAGAAVVVALLVLAIFADVLAPSSYNATAPREAFQRPGPSHWFGTDQLGRDVLSRVIYGARISMYAGIAATVISVCLASLIGIPSGYFGRWIDLLFQRVVDAWMAFPGLVAIIVILALLGPGLWHLVLALGISLSFPLSRTIRGATQVIREQPFIEASLAAGASHVRILLRHVLPNVLAPIIIVASNAIGVIILAEAAVSFLGYGVPPPQPSWGGMLSATGRSHMVRAPWLSIFPGLALGLAVFGFNVLGDALRDLLDPRLRGGA
jgi:peptide/nickel transport system permease protein